MYKVTTRPSKIITKAGKPQILEIGKAFETKREGSSPPEPMSSPRPVFKKSPVKAQPNDMTAEPITPAHEDNVRFIQHAWNAVAHEMEMAKRHGTDGPIYYQEKSPNPKLKDFQPFDLEEWWGKQTLKNIHES